MFFASPVKLVKVHLRGIRSRPSIYIYEWAYSVPLRAKASLKGKLDQSSCDELVHMIILVFIIYWSSLCSIPVALISCSSGPVHSCDFLEGVCPFACWSASLSSAYAGVPHCRTLCSSAALESCHMSSQFPFQDCCLSSHVICFCQLSYPSVRNSVSKWETQDFSFHFLWLTWRCFCCTLVKFQVWHPCDKHGKTQDASASKLRINFLSISMNFSDQNALHARAILLFTLFPWCVGSPLAGQGICIRLHTANLTSGL